jgi:hypothetical protein
MCKKSLSITFRAASSVSLSTLPATNISHVAACKFDYHSPARCFIQQQNSPNILTQLCSAQEKELQLPMTEHVL